MYGSFHIFIGVFSEKEESIVGSRDRSATINSKLREGDIPMGLEILVGDDSFGDGRAGGTMLTKFQRYSGHC